jgi:hypothetical protein
MPVDVLEYCLHHFTRLPSVHLLQILMRPFQKYSFTGLLPLVFLASCILTWVQQTTTIIEEKPLFGDIQQRTNPTLSIESWFDGNYQIEKEKVLNESFAFRNFFIRLKNQIDFFLFQKSSAKEVIIGKENYLFEKNYIQSYQGADFIGEEAIQVKCRMLRAIQDKLLAMKKTLLVVIAPGKGFYYPEFLPEAKADDKKNSTNYEIYKNMLMDNHIHFIDFNAYFMEEKRKSDFPLFPQYGIHWSFWASCHALDSMITKLEILRQQDLANLHLSDPQFYPPSGGDYDIGFGLNLLSQLPSFEMAYGNLRFDSVSVKPSALTIGDSFYWSQYNLGLKSVFKNHHFWYYYRQKYPQDKLIEKSQKHFVIEEITNNDIIIILATEAHLNDFGWGFIEDCFQELNDISYN